MAESKGLEVIYRPIDELEPYEKNAKLHPEWHIDQIAESIRKFGFNDPIGLASDTMEIIEGHGRLLAVKKYEDLRTKYPKLPTIDLVHLDSDQRLAYRLVHNQTTMNTGFDNVLLYDELKYLDEETDIDLSEIGWDDNILMDLEKELGVEDQIDDTEPEQVEVPEEPISKPGQLYELGHHRLLCGDATSADDLEKLMNGEKADMVFTDPPYNVNLGQANPRWKSRKIVNDNMSTEDYIQFCKDFSLNFKNYIDDCIYVCHAPGPDGRNLAQVLDDLFHWSATVMWVKDRFTLGRGKMHRRYEPIWFGWGVSGQKFSERRDIGDVWEFVRPGNSEEHPTMKPIKLVLQAIEYASKRNDIILDVFGGSGTTLLAAERSHRKCYMMEIEPKYVDVIINRWETETGKKAKLLN